jgi:hypothetical protein
MENVSFNGMLFSNYVLLWYHRYTVVYGLKPRPPPLQNSVFNAEGGYIAECIGSPRHYGYSLPELPPDYR